MGVKWEWWGLMEFVVEREGGEGGIIDDGGGVMSWQ
jgi:hypothetical protein